MIEGGGSEVKNTCLTNIKELFTPNSTLFTEFKNLFPFLRYLRSKFAKMGIFGPKINQKMVFFCSQLQIISSDGPMFT